ncbi:MAG: polyprenyl synthetase family protein [Candidatus Omnitrophica bacterium]|nr:polyprenyl synthetase family protein [Candidatus Omnitrophota bacterium]
MARTIKFRGKDYLADVFFPVKKELSSWKKSYGNLLRREEKFFFTISEYLLSFPQGEFGPGLVFLSAKAIRGEEINSSLLSKLEKFSLAIEIFHTALLLQNSLVQNVGIVSENGLELNTQKQNSALLFSHYLFSEAFFLLKELELTDLFPKFIEIFREMVEVKIREMDFLNHFRFIEDDYLEVVKSKTAKFLSLACWTGAYLCGGRDLLRESLSNFGLNFGLSLQIVDDCLKVMDENNSFIHDLEIKKDDFSLIYLFPFLPEEERMEVINFLREKKDLPHTRALALVYRTVELALKKAKYFSDQAKENIKILPKSRFRESLIALADFPLERLA